MTNFWVTIWLQFLEKTITNQISFLWISYTEHILKMHNRDAANIPPQPGLPELVSWWHILSLTSTNAQLADVAFDSTLRQEFLTPLPLYHPVFTIVIYGWYSGSGIKNCCRQVPSLCFIVSVCFGNILCDRLVHKVILKRSHCCLRESISLGTLTSRTNVTENYYFTE